MALLAIAAIAAVCAGGFLIAVILTIHYLRAPNRETLARRSEGVKNNLDVTVYAYEPDVSGLDDIKARHIGVYRDTGVITGIEDDCAVYKESFTPTTDNDRELTLLVRSAAEVKRVTDKTMLYFFKRVRPIRIKSGGVREIYDCISSAAGNNRPVVLRMTRTASVETKQ